MANPTCGYAHFGAETSCFKSFNREERKSLLIYFYAKELAAIGGKDYTAQLGHSGTLSADSECYKRLDNPSCPPSLILLDIASYAAVNAGATVASTKDALATAIACNKDFPPVDKDAQILWLICNLGQHKSYPQ